MIFHHGAWWPDDVGQKWKHALRHVRNLETTIPICQSRRTAVQAGGNIGLWPRRLAADFERVYTWEPEPRSMDCLVRNVPAHVLVSEHAIGESATMCGIVRRSLGSHQVIEGDDVAVTTIDALRLNDVDLIQLDIEGYEWHALMGAEQTIARCHPVIHLELRGFTVKYGKSDADVLALLAGLGYREQARLHGNDVVFTAAR